MTLSKNNKSMIIFSILVLCTLLIFVLSINIKCNRENFIEYADIATQPPSPGRLMLTDPNGNLSTYDLGINNVLLSNANGNISTLPVGQFNDFPINTNNNITSNGLLNANGGMTSTTGTYTGLLNANGGMTSTTGTYTGLLNANGGMTSTTGTYTGLLKANGGMTSTTGTYTGLLNANGGMTSTTGTYTGLLKANGGMTGTSGTYTDIFKASNKSYFSSWSDNEIMNTPGIVNIKNPNGTATHFGYIDGKNYIRGNTQIDGNLTLSNSLCINNSCMNEIDIPKPISIYRTPVWGAGTFTVKLTDFSPIPANGLYTLTIKRNDGNLAWRFIGIIAIYNGFVSNTNYDFVNMTLTVSGGNISLNLINGYPDVFIFTLKPLQLY